jgi:hypothetical protein
MYVCPYSSVVLSLGKVKVGRQTSEGLAWTAMAEAAAVRRAANFMVGEDKAR